MVQQSKKKSPQKGSKQKFQHKFNNVREVILSDIGTSAVLSTATNNQGTAFTRSVLSPLGLNGCSWDGAKFVGTVFEKPHLRWLQSQAVNFGSYRILRAKVVFVGNLGSTTTGQLSVACFRDVLDAAGDPYQGYTAGPNSRVFDLASTSQREASIPIPVDTSWKKVSYVMAIGGDAKPFTSGTTTGFIPVNSANDLCFGAFSAVAVGAPLSTTIGNWYLDYDIEFKEPQSNILNV